MYIKRTRGRWTIWPSVKARAIQINRLPPTHAGIAAHTTAAPNKANVWVFLTHTRTHTHEHVFMSKKSKRHVS